VLPLGNIVLVEKAQIWDGVSLALGKAYYYCACWYLKLSAENLPRGLLIILKGLGERKPYTITSLTV